MWRKQATVTYKAPSPIFIIARFRTGSTLLWSFFDILKEKFVAFYEPLHEELRAYIYQKQQHPSLKHNIHTQNPFYIYKKLPSSILRLHSSDFAYKKLYLSSTDSYPSLKRWIKELIKWAYKQQRIPVLQFNRADFRVAWLKRNFPDAYIIYLFRNPRNQYVSFLKASGLKLPEGIKSSPLSWLSDKFIPYREYGQHLFYVRQWRILLSYQFPFFITRNFLSSYEISYILWKLSLLLNSKKANVVLHYEQDFTPPYDVLSELLKRKIISSKDPQKLKNIIRPIHTNKWQELADSEWFLKQEKRCDRLFKQLGLVPFYGYIPLKLIKLLYFVTWYFQGGLKGDKRYIKFFEKYYARSAHIYIQHLKTLFQQT